MALVEAAKANGLDDVKTQVFQIETLFAPEALKYRPELLERKQYETPWEWQKPLANRCKELGLGYGVTVFRHDDVRRAALEADWLKASSYSLLDSRLLEALAGQPKDVVVSTGMASDDELEDALKPFSKRKGVTLLHCVSAYPAPIHEANLRSIRHLRMNHKHPVGWSDHTTSGLVVGRAINVYRASMVEIHWDLEDRLGAETRHSWVPSTWQDFLRSRPTEVDGYYACDGKHGRKAPTLSEDKERLWRADPRDGLRPLRHVRDRLAPSERAGGTSRRA
jgi:N-acetylneuraminate synthase